MKIRWPIGHIPTIAHARGYLQWATEHPDGVVGLDLSLTSPAAAWIPKGWDGKPGKIHTACWPDPDFPTGANSVQKAQRWQRITNAVRDFCTEHMPIAIGVEDYAFSARSSSVTRLAELGGIVRIDLYRCNPSWLPIELTASYCRKTLLQRVPRKGAKDWTHANMRRLGGDWNGDEMDAICVANGLAATIGWPALSFPGYED